MDTQTLRPAVLHHLVEKLGTPSRLKLQKLNYILQEGLGVPTKYRFGMRHQGPISDELTNQVDWMRATGYLSVWDDPDKPGYLVMVTAEPEPEWQEQTQRYSEALDHLLRALAHRPDQYLDLIASVLFVQRIQPENSGEKTLRDGRGHEAEDRDGQHRGGLHGTPRTPHSLRPRQNSPPQENPECQTPL